MRTMVSTAGGVSGAMDAPDGLAPGAKAGPWVVERELGRGGMGAVYAVVHEEIGKRAALKVVHKQLLTPGFNVERILLEAKVVNQVGHPNIVDIFETGTLEDGRPYIVMERLEGEPLSQRADNSKIQADQVIAILLQVCDALVAAHAAGVIHRDLKLDNIFLVDNPDDPNTPKVKLLDWGIAKIINHDVRHTVEGQLVGTPQYLSPEQARGAEVGPESDVYSLGVLAYELFVEQLPFEAETSAEIMVMHLRATPPPPSELWPEIPALLEHLLLAMLAKQTEQRPSMLEVARHLEAVRDELVRRQQAGIERGIETVAIEAPRAGRRTSKAGLAPTVPVEWQHRSKRWQFVVGALAIAASVMMLLFSRAGDSRAAAAATTAPPGQIAPEPLAVRDDLAATTMTPDDVAPSAPIRERALPRAAPRPTQAASKVRSTPASHRPSPRKAPALPPRDKRIDPDGTIDPYR
jgi:tRNA A-37 threonylcarbamoyl transferase component Bud32